MDDFLTSRFQTLESVADIRSTFANSHTPNPKKSNNFRKPNLSENKKVNSYSTNVTNNSDKCALCHQLHPLRFCPSFLGMSIDGRYNVVKQQKRCTNCLGASHEYKQCKSKFLCNICKKKHHSLLHRYQPNSTSNQPRAMPQNPPHGNTNSSAKSGHIRENQPPPQLNVTPSTSKDATTRELQSYSTQLQSPSSSVILGTAIVDVYNDDIKCTVRALIDSASEATFISKKLQMKLGLKTRPLQVDVHGLNGSLTATSTQICNIRIGSPVDKLSKNPQLKMEYDRVITEYSTLGQMTNVTPKKEDLGVYYLPHHAVYKPDSTTTKLRVVFNASCSSSNGVSLNDLLHPGPVLQAELTILVLRWRLFRYVFNADMEKMYHKRVKWKYPQRDFAPGDLVIVKQDNLPPNQWRLGRIDQVCHGPDKRVRVADIRTATGVVTRPISKLVLLPNPSDDSL